MTETIVVTTARSLTDVSFPVSINIDDRDIGTTDVNNYNMEVEEYTDSGDYMYEDEDDNNMEEPVLYDDTYADYLDYYEDAIGPYTDYLNKYLDHAAESNWKQISKRIRR